VPPCIKMLWCFLVLQFLLRQLLLKLSHLQVYNLLLKEHNVWR
jgi:hypothetical protein